MKGIEIPKHVLIFNIKYVIQLLGYNKIVSTGWVNSFRHIIDFVSIIMFYKMIMLILWGKLN